MASYSSLTTFRKCPRLYGFGLLKYKPIEVPEPLMTGQLVHTAIAAHFKNTSPQEAMGRAVKDSVEKVEAAQFDDKKRAKYLKGIGTSHNRALTLISRYIGKWTVDYSAVLIETWVTLGNARGIIDLIAFYQEQRVIVDYKTSKSPDMRWYDVSGQIDLYAYMLKEAGTDIALVIYDVISDEGIYRQTRPPRLEAGHKLYQEIEALTMYSNTDWLLEHCHFNYDCPQRCDFWLPCWLLETADWSACEDYLEKNYIKKEAKNETK